MAMPAAMLEDAPATRLADSLDDMPVGDMLADELADAQAASPAAEWQCALDFDFIGAMLRKLHGARDADAATIRRMVAEEEDAAFADAKIHVPSMTDEDVVDMRDYIRARVKNPRALLAMVKARGDAVFAGFVSFCRELMTEEVAGEDVDYTFTGDNLENVARNIYNYVDTDNGEHVKAGELFQGMDEYDRRWLAAEVCRISAQGEQARQAAARRKGKRARADAPPPLVQSTITDEEVKRIREDKDTTNVRFAIPPPPTKEFQGFVRYALELDDMIRKIHGGGDWLVDTSGKEGKRDKLEAMLRADEIVDADEAWLEFAWVVRKIDNSIKNAAVVQRLVNGEAITQARHMHKKYYTLCKPAFKAVGMSIPLAVGVLDNKGKAVYAEMSPEEATKVLDKYDPGSVETKSRQQKSTVDNNVKRQLDAQAEEIAKLRAENAALAAAMSPGAGTSAAAAATPAATPASGVVTQATHSTPGSHHQPASAFQMTPALQGVAEVEEGEEPSGGEEDEHAGEEDEEEEARPPKTRGGGRRGKAPATKRKADDVNVKAKGGKRAKH